MHTPTGTPAALKIRIAGGIAYFALISVEPVGLADEPFIRGRERF